MFKQIFLFELKLWLKKPATYIFFFVFFGLSMFATAALSGLIGTSGDTNVTINSAKAIAESLNGLITDIVGIIILITIIAPAVYKDFQYNMHPLLFTNPITKFGYMFGRFFASFLVAMFVITGVQLGTVWMIIKTLATLSERDTKAAGDLIANDVNDENAVIIRRTNEMRKVTSEINKALV